MNKPLIDVKMETTQVSEAVSQFNISLEIDQLDENQNLTNKSQKSDYQTRKVDAKLKKYEAIIRNVEKIERVQESEFLFVGNGGLSNNISHDFLQETFSQFGQITDIVMQRKKPYSFVIYEDKQSALLAVEKLQATEITKNQTPIFFYIFPVDKVPDISMDSEYREIATSPDGLTYIENYINEDYARRIEDVITKSSQALFNVNPSDKEELIHLKKRQVKHYGYEFRYGTNDCDGDKPLTDPDSRMPEVLTELFEKMLHDKLITDVPDQMTVNFYEPGQGIPPHTDNINAFDKYIISLSLKSSVKMEFRENGTKRCFKCYLRPNSLLVLKGDSRYNWAHLIAERKHDLIIDEKNVPIVKKREKRISLTFRKIKDAGGQSVRAEPKKPDEINLPMTDVEAVQFERAHVHEVYNGIADHFSSTRHSAWPGVAKFIRAMDPYSMMVDVGCGNGKYLNLRKDLFAFGCDYSDQLIKICYERNFNSFVSDCLKIPCKTDFYDYLISIAVLHHLSTQERRVLALKEMLRVLKPGGKALVTVWAKEQKYKEKESFYVSKKGNKTDDNSSKAPQKQKIKIPESTNESESSPMCHKFGNEFQKQDLFVAWHYSDKTGKKNKKDEDKALESEKKAKEEKVFLRFYHVFQNKELEELFEKIPNAKILESYYEQGNWCAIFEKVV